MVYPMEAKVKIWLVFVKHFSFCETFMKAFKTEELAVRQVEEWKKESPELTFRITYTKVVE